MAEAPIKKQQKEAFKTLVYEYYRLHARSLPWRRTKNPYRILVSEIMLQQTQVDRVLPKYKVFLKQFPTIESLAESSLRDVLEMWSGLGYNRRARMLHECAKEVVARYNGKLPKNKKELESLPGIGPYTAGAICAFAYNLPEVIIETNIRTVYIHYFFKNKEHITDAELLPYIEATLDRDDPRMWYSALMDYGTHLKKTIGNQNVRSVHYTKQSPFKDSNRYIRGKVIALLTEKPRQLETLAKHIDAPRERILAQCEALQKEEMLTRRGRVWAVA